MRNRKASKEYISCADWPAGTCPSLNDHTEDEHFNEDAATAVCDLLVEEGYAGEGKVFPLRVWIKPKPETK